MRSILTLLLFPLLAASAEVRFLNIDASPPPPGYPKRVAPRGSAPSAAKHRPTARPRSKPVVLKPGRNLA